MLLSKAIDYLVKIPVPVMEKHALSYRSGKARGLLKQFRPFPLLLIAS